MAVRSLRGQRVRRDQHGHSFLHRLSLRVPDAAGFVLCLVAVVWFARKGLWRTINSYDEGILVSNADAMLHGQRLYTDVYANYSPGAFVVLAGLFSVFGKSLLVSRLLGLVLHVALGLLAGRLGARMSRRDAGHAFSWLGAGVVSVWTLPLLSIPFAWLWGMVLALFAVDRLVTWEGRWTARRSVLFGVACGLVGVFRHEILLVGLVAGLGLWFVVRVLGGSRGGDRSRLQAKAAGCGLVATLAAGWGPFLVQSGFHQIYRCVVQLQVDRVLPGRRIPLPNLLGQVEIGGLHVPAVFAHYYATGAALVLGIVPLGLVILVGWLRLHVTEPFARPRLLAVGGLLAVAVASVPQLLQRADPTHVLYAAPPALILVVGAAEGMWGRAHAVVKNRMAQLGAPLLAGVVLVVSAWSSITSPFTPLLHARYRLDGRFGHTRADSLTRRDAVQFLAANTTPSERIWSGCVNSRRVSANELDLYFLADRRGGSRWMQYDPGLQDREDVQRAIVADLDRNHVRVAVLAPCKYEVEPNASARFGSSVLDNWFKREFRIVGGRDGYRFLLRSVPPRG